MIKEIQVAFYANRLKETRKVFYSDEETSYFELGKGNSFYKACYSFILCKHFGIEVPEIRRVNKNGMYIYCQKVYSNWEEFDFTSNFSFTGKRKISQLQNRSKIIRLALFDEQFMVNRNKDDAYNLALIKNKNHQIVSRDYYDSLNSNYRKGDRILNSLFFRNVINSLSLEEILQEIENYFSLQDSIIEEKVLLLSAYLNESKYKELYLSFLSGKDRNEEIRSEMLKTVYLLKR